MPSIPGMLMSSSSTSGWSLAASGSASSPEAAAPTTSMSFSKLSSLARCSRVSAMSSTIRTRIFGLTIGGWASRNCSRLDVSGGTDSMCGPEGRRSYERARTDRHRAFGGWGEKRNPARCPRRVCRSEEMERCWSEEDGQQPLRLRRCVRLDARADPRQDRADLATQEDQGGNRDDGDESQNQCVLSESLTLFLIPLEQIELHALLLIPTRWFLL